MIKIAKNPLFRIGGIIAVLYYGLFQSNSENGLNKRLSPNKIKSNISEISQKSVYIIDNVQRARSESVKKPDNINSDTNKKIEEVKSEEK